MHKLHNLNSDLHEPSPQVTEQPKIESKFGPDTHSMLEPDTKMGRQERQAKVLTLHSKVIHSQILMTAFAINDNLFEQYTEKDLINGFLQKPISLDDLHDEVNNQLHKYELLRQSL